MSRPILGRARDGAGRWTGPSSWSAAFGRARNRIRALIVLFAAVRLGYKQALVARMPEEIPSGIRVIEARTLRSALD